MSVTSMRNLLKLKSTINRRASIALTQLRSESNVNVSPNEKNILKSGLADVDVPNIPLDELVFLNSSKYHDLIATECGVTGRKYTYEELRNRVLYFSRNLRKKLKLEKGACVALLLPNVPEFGIAALGCLKAGLVVTTINPIYTPSEISRQLTDSSTKAIITLNELFPLAKASAAESDFRIPIITIKNQSGERTPPGGINFDEFVEKVDFPDLPPCDYETLAFLPYSSGTTGLPKGVELTHRNIATNLVQFNYKEIGIIEDTTSAHQDVVPTILPQFHIYGLVANMINLINRGCKQVSLPRFTPELYVATLAQHRPHILFLAPPLVLFLTAHPSVTTALLDSVRVVTSGAAPLGAADEARFLRKAGKPIAVFQGYGLTETAPMLTMSRMAEVADAGLLARRGGSIGKMVASTFGKVVDPEAPGGAGLGANQPGELLVKGRQVMRGYHNRPAETAGAFTADGWFRTGDIVTYNEEGFIFVKDRLKELIKVKGFQVPPAELEEVIRGFAGVEEAAVVGVGHAASGEVPRAYVVAKRGRRLDVGELNKFVNERVAEYKQLRGGVEVVESIPKNASGKIMRRVLKLKYEEELSRMK